MNLDSIGRFDAFIAGWLCALLFMSVTSSEFCPSCERWGYAAGHAIRTMVGLGEEK